MGKKAKYKELRRKAEQMPEAVDNGVPVNHYKRMKDLYKGHGVAGVNAYIKGVNSYTVARAWEEKRAKDNLGASDGAAM